MFVITWENTYSSGQALWSLGSCLGYPWLTCSPSTVIVQSWTQHSCRGTNKLTSSVPRLWWPRPKHNIHTCPVWFYFKNYSTILLWTQGFLCKTRNLYNVWNQLFMSRLFNRLWMLLLSVLHTLVSLHFISSPLLLQFILFWALINSVQKPAHQINNDNSIEKKKLCEILTAPHKKQLGSNNKYRHYKNMLTIIISLNSFDISIPNVMKAITFWTVWR